VHPVGAQGRAPHPNLDGSDASCEGPCDGRQLSRRATSSPICSMISSASSPDCVARLRAPATSVVSYRLANSPDFIISSKPRRTWPSLPVSRVACCRIFSASCNSICSAVTSPSAADGMTHKRREWGPGAPRRAWPRAATRPDPEQVAGTNRDAITRRRRGTRLSPRNARACARRSPFVEKPKRLPRRTGACQPVRRGSLVRAEPSPQGPRVSSKPH